MILSPHEAAWLALNIGKWTPTVARVMVAIACAESGLNTDIIGRSTAAGPSLGQRDHGLWQISGRWWGAELQTHRWRDPYDNCRMARKVWDRHGFDGWAVYTSGAHAVWLPDAAFGVAAPFPPPPAQAAWRT